MKINNFYLKILLTFFSIIIFIISIQIFQTDIEETKVGISINAIVKQDDTFQLFYIAENLNNRFNEENSINVNVEGSDQLQKINFFLPDSIFLKELRLDIGENREQGPIYIESIDLKYTDSLISFKGSEILNNFKINKFLSVSAETTLFTTYVKNKKYDPFLLSKNINSIYTRLLKESEQQKSTNVIPIIIFVLILIGLLYIMYKDYSLRKLGYISFTLLFFLILLAPHLDQMLNIVETKNNEKRELEKKPVFSYKMDMLSTYPKAFEKYYNDNFGFRQLLVDFGSKIKVSLFNSSSLPDKVVIGKENWFFLHKNIKHLLNKSLYNQEQLDRKISKMEGKKNWLKSKNTPYYLAVWPNKSTIYSEYLPNIVNLKTKKRFSKIDQLIQTLGEKNSSLKITDVREELIKSKSKAQLYYKYDSHWNHYGAYIAFKKLMKQISTEIEEVDLIEFSDFNINKLADSLYDLSVMLGLPENDYIDYKYEFIYKLDEAKIKEDKNIPSYPKKTIIHTNLTSKNELTLLVFRDSFTTYLIPFISPQFKKVVYIWSDFDKKIVNKVKPDIVIEGMVERSFD